MTVDEAIAEFHRQRRLTDQMATMQSKLRDWNSLAAFCSTSFILVSSTVGVAFAFASNAAQLTIWGITAERTTWLGWLAVATVCLTTIDLLIDRRSAARGRADAVSLLSELKSEYRAALPSGGEVAELERISAKYTALMSEIPPIPEHLFNRLKAKHLRKVEVSKILSANAGISVLWARCLLWKRNH
jgi:hypothetical protein